MAKDKKLSDEDRILWSKVARTTRALPGRMEMLDVFEEIVPPREEEKPEDTQRVLKANFVVLTLGSAADSAKKTHIHHALEKPVKRKLARGRLPIEGRIDLHGMFQDEAHGLLLQFLLRAHDRGLRHVLVITGKGASYGSDGALKRAVPLWFSLPEFRPLISSYEPAARNHGGDGALYVRLSKRDLSR